MKSAFLSIVLLTVLCPCLDGGIRSGAVWPDNRGIHVNAHGGGVLSYRDIYYLYGEHKIYGPAGNKAHVGVHVYSSFELENWTDEGIALAVSEESGSDIEDGCILERPKVLRCERTGKFVMFFHLEPKGAGYTGARTGIAVADSPTGPFRFLRSLRPNAGRWPENVPAEDLEPAAIDKARSEICQANGAPNEAVRRSKVFVWDHETGQMSRDMTLFKDDDGRAYHIYASEHNSTIQIAELTEDYLDYTGRYWRVLVNEWTEAPAVCKKGGTYYLLGSGCTGWSPNAARMYAAKSLQGPWRYIGNPCRGVNPANGLDHDKTWGAQSAHLFRLNGKDGRWVALFDIWNPANAIDGRYVLLPLEFGEDGVPTLTWRNEWTP